MLESATKRPAKTPEAPHRGRTRNSQHEEENGRRGDADLERAPDEDLAPDPADFGEGELEPDGEEEQHDSHLGEHLDVILRLDDTDARWPGDRAGDDERDDRGDADAAQNEDEDQGDRVGQYQFGQGCVHGHDSV